jgi:hypothetical protein
VYLPVPLGLFGRIRIGHARRGKNFRISAYHFGVISVTAERTVTGVTENTADKACRMVVVHNYGFDISRYSTAFAGIMTIE